MISVEKILAKRRHILDVIKAAGRHLDDVTILAVTKKRSLEEIQNVLAAGFSVIGENRIQEAADKFPLLPPCERHLIGHLQKNKVRKAVALFDCIQSVDSLALAQTIDRVCAEDDKVMPIFLEVNTAADFAKFGFTPETLEQALPALIQLKNIRIEGLMTIGALDATSEETRKTFRSLRSLFDSLQKSMLPALRHCSMGMSTDFQIAIEEGATMIRIGSFLFQE